MNDLGQIWSEKSDEALLEAAAGLDDFTEEGRRVILAELEKRGLELPESRDDEALPEAGPSCLRCGVELQHLGTRNTGTLGEFGRMFEGRELLEIYACPRCGQVDLFTDVVEEAAADKEEEEP